MLRNLFQDFISLLLCAALFPVVTIATTIFAWGKDSPSPDSRQCRLTETGTVRICVNVIDVYSFFSEGLQSMIKKMCHLQVCCKESFIYNPLQSLLVSKQRMDVPTSNLTCLNCRAPWTNYFSHRLQWWSPWSLTVYCASHNDCGTLQYALNSS